MSEVKQNRIQLEKEVTSQGKSAEPKQKIKEVKHKNEDENVCDSMCRRIYKYMNHCQLKVC